MGKPVKHIAKETLFVFAALTCMCIIIVFTSIVNAGFDIEKIFEKENISNAVINAAITIFGTVAAVPAGIVATKQRRAPDGSLGRYLQEFDGYNKIRAKVEPRRLAFNQWHAAQHRKELHQKQVEYLLSKGVLQAEDVLKLPKDQVVKLTTSQKFVVDDKTLFFKALTDEQIHAVLHVLAGKINVHKLPDFYFLYVDGKSSSSFYDQAYYETRNANLSFVVNLISKIFTGFVITSIFTGLVITDNPSDLTNAEIVLKAIIMVAARVFNAITSTLWGWLLGQEMVYTECYYINGRTQFLELFDNDTSFVEKDIQTQAKEDFELEESQNEN
jgi:hypothetical protein